MSARSAEFWGPSINYPYLTCAKDFAVNWRRVCSHSTRTKNSQFLVMQKLPVLIVKFMVCFHLILRKNIRKSIKPPQRARIKQWLQWNETKMNLCESTLVTWTSIFSFLMIKCIKQQNIHVEFFKLQSASNHYATMKINLNLLSFWAFFFRHRCVSRT